MRKLFLLLALTLCAGLWAQEIDAVEFVEGQTTDWYSFGKSSRIEVITDDSYGNPIIEGMTYDLTKGNEETAFGTDPLSAIKEAAKNELEAKKTEANNRMSQKAMGYELIEEVQRTIQQGDEMIMLG